MTWRGHSPDPEQRWAATTFSIAFAAGAALSFAVCNPAIAVADSTPAVINCSQPPQVKPDRIILTCADNNVAVDKIVWTSWNSISGVTGHGIEYQDDCVPNCAQGSATYNPVTITLIDGTAPDFLYTGAIVTDPNTGKSHTWRIS